MAEITESTSVQSAFLLKLSQLQKVLEYLTHHFEEHIFQVKTLQNRYEDEENRIVRDTQISIDSIFSSIKLQNSQASKKINEEYINDTNELKTELGRIKFKITNSTVAELNKFISDLEFNKGKLGRILKEMKKEIIILKDDKKIDPLDVHKRLKEMIDAHQKALDTHDQESKRKQEQLDSILLDKENEIKNKYMTTIIDLRRQLRPPPQIRAQIIQNLQNMTNELSELRTEINKTRSSAKKIAATNFTINSYKVRQMTSSMEKEIESFNEKFDKAKILLQDTVFQLKAEKSVLFDKRNEHRAKLNLEIEQLEEELKDTDPIHLLRKRMKKEEEEIEERISKLQKEVNEIKDLNSLHESEIEGLKNKFAEDIKYENEDFEDKKKDLNEQIKIQKQITEKLKEKHALHNKKKELLLKPGKSINKVSLHSEIDEIDSLFRKEYTKAQIEKKTEISNIFTELDNEFDRRKDERRVEYEKQIALVAKEYKENDVVLKVSNQYQELLKSLETQLEEIEVPEKNEAEPVTEHKRKQMDLKNKINESRQQLIVSYEDQMREEDKRFRSSSFFADDIDYKSMILEERGKMKQSLLFLEERIAVLEIEISKNERKAKLDDNYRTMKEDSNFQVKRALQQKTDASKALIAQITACSESFSNLIHEEKKNNSLEPIKFQAEFDQLSQNLNAIHEKFEHEKRSLNRANVQKTKFLRTSFESEMKNIKEKIASTRLLIDEQGKSFGIEREHLQVNFNKMLAQQEAEMLGRIPMNRSDQTLFLNNKIATLTRERDAKKRQYNNNSGMREQEREKIDRLEILMCDKSKLLAELGKELVLAREQSLRKENESIVAPFHAPKNPLSMSGHILSKRATSAVEIKKPPNLSRSTGKMLNLK